MTQETILHSKRILRNNQFYPFRKVRRNKAKLHRNTWVSVTLEFNKAIMDLIIDNNYEFKMPYNLGVISIKKMIPRTKITLDNGEEVYVNHTRSLLTKKFVKRNERDGYIYAFRWKRGAIKNITKYYFRPYYLAKKKLYKIACDPFDKRDYYILKNKRYGI